MLKKTLAMHRNELSVYFSYSTIDSIVRLVYGTESTDRLRVRLKLLVVTLIKVNYISENEKNGSRELIFFSILLLFYISLY